MKRYKIAVLDGDGIGPEVVQSATRVLVAACKASSVDIETIHLPIGLESYKKYGRTLPPESLEGMKESDGWILGPLQAGAYPKDDKDYPMASGKIRKAFDLYANIRPVRSLLKDGKTGIDLVIVRENTEGFYPDRNLFKGNGEFWPNEDTVLSLRVVSRKASRRIAETAFALARARSKKKLVTAVHKSNVLIEGDGLFMHEVKRVAEIYEDVQLNDGLVDSIGMQLVTNPEDFDVLVTTNLFGDILSDVAAASVGGLGLAPSLNSSDDHAMAQAVHGSAPDIAGKGIANPVAEILSASMLLSWLRSKNEDDSLRVASEIIVMSVEKVLGMADPAVLTPDLGGSGSTKRFTEAVLSQISS